jgi:hypothetical protein
MSIADSHNREQLRQSYVDAWRKRTSRAIMSPLEAMIADVIGEHPEYQPMLLDADRALALDPGAEAVENPFLHMGLHMAVREQLAIDRPPGVRGLHARLLATYPDPHHAEHILMEALAETLWEAQREGRGPDAMRYLELARRRAGTT